MSYLDEKSHYGRRAAAFVLSLTALIVIPPLFGLVGTVTPFSDDKSDWHQSYPSIWAIGASAVAVFNLFMGAWMVISPRIRLIILMLLLALLVIISGPVALVFWLS